MNNKTTWIKIRVTVRIVGDTEKWVLECGHSILINLPGLSEILKCRFSHSPGFSSFTFPIWRVRWFACFIMCSFSLCCRVSKYIHILFYQRIYMFFHAKEFHPLHVFPCLSMPTELDVTSYMTGKLLKWTLIPNPQIYMFCQDWI